VSSSDQGLHTWDDRLTDFTMPAVLARRRHVTGLLARVGAMRTAAWARDDRIDWLLFRAQLEGVAFFDRVMQTEATNPQLYVGECSNALFSLLKKNYASHTTRARAALARLRAMPALLAQGRRNLVRPVRLYAQLAIDAARSGDDLFTQSLMTLADSLSEAERGELARARDSAVLALHGFADWLAARLPAMVAWRPMGEANYNYLLRNVYLLPLDANQVAMLGEAELARFRGLEAMLKDPALASPDPARAAHVPKDQDEFLATYQSRQREMVDYLTTNRLVTIPAYIGPFLIRQLPEAFKPTSPGGFMNPPGVYDADSSGFYFIPTYNPSSGNFYIRAAIEDPRPILGHEGIPGHFLQLSIANHLTDEIRRQHSDGVFVEGWALYTEEMLMRTGFYPEQSASQGQVLRLSRYRAARIGVDVNLQTGRLTFDQAVVLHGSGGLDREAAVGEAAGAASAVAEDHVHGRQVADPAAPREVPLSPRRRLPSGRVPRYPAVIRQPPAFDRRMADARRLDRGHRTVTLTDMDHLTKLISHLAWADDRVLAALRSADAPDPNCLELFAHVLAAEHVWLARLKGEAPHHPVWPALTLEECAGLVQANQRAWTAYVGTLAATDSSRAVTYTNSAGQRSSTSRTSCCTSACTGRITAARSPGRRARAAAFRCRPTTSRSPAVRQRPRAMPATDRRSRFKSRSARRATRRPSPTTWSEFHGQRRQTHSTRQDLPRDPRQDPTQEEAARCAARQARAGVGVRAVLD
jgi:uncharacterized protein (DUF885 family)